MAKPVRQVYPLDITRLMPAITAAAKKTKIKSRAEIMRMAIERGLPVLVRQLATDTTTPAA